MSVVRLEPRGAEGQPGGLAAGNNKYVTALQALTQVVTPEQESVATPVGKPLHIIPRRTLAHSLEHRVQAKDLTAEGSSWPSMHHPPASAITVAGG